MHSLDREIKIEERLANPRLPLAVYREVAAHLRQVDEVETKLIVRPLSSSEEQFDYAKSQIAALAIAHPENLPQADKSRIAEILDYYAQRYGSWQHPG